MSGITIKMDNFIPLKIIPHPVREGFSNGIRRSAPLEILFLTGFMIKNIFFIDFIVSRKIKRANLN